VGPKRSLELSLTSVQLTLNNAFLLELSENDLSEISQSIRPTLNPRPGLQIFLAVSHEGLDKKL
jgi:hypothetical protein